MVDDGHSERGTEVINERKCETIMEEPHSEPLSAGDDSEERTLSINTETAEMTISCDMDVDQESDEVTFMIPPTPSQPPRRSSCPLVVSGVDSDTATIVSLPSPDISSSSGWSADVTEDEETNKERFNTLRVRGSLPAWFNLETSSEEDIRAGGKSGSVRSEEVTRKSGVAETVRPGEPQTVTQGEEERESGVVETSENVAGGIRGGVRGSRGGNRGSRGGGRGSRGGSRGSRGGARGGKGGNTGGGGGGTGIRGGGGEVRGGNRRDSGAGEELRGGVGASQEAGKEAAGEKRNQKRKRTGDHEPSKKKCRAMHGIDHKELWCKPCTNSKKCTKYI